MNFLNLLYNFLFFSSGTVDNDSGFRFGFQSQNRALNIQLGLSGYRRGFPVFHLQGFYLKAENSGPVEMGGDYGGITALGIPTFQQEREKRMSDIARLDADITTQV